MTDHPRWVQPRLDGTLPEEFHLYYWRYGKRYHEAFCTEMGREARVEHAIDWNYFATVREPDLSLD